MWSESNYVGKPGARKNWSSEQLHMATFLRYVLLCINSSSRDTNASQSISSSSLNIGTLGSELARIYTHLVITFLFKEPKYWDKFSVNLRQFWMWSSLREWKYSSMSTDSHSFQLCMSLNIKISRYLKGEFKFPLISGLTFSSHAIFIMRRVLKRIIAQVVANSSSWYN